MIEKKAPIQNLDLEQKVLRSDLRSVYRFSENGGIDTTKSVMGIMDCSDWDKEIKAILFDGSENATILEGVERPRNEAWKNSGKSGTADQPFVANPLIDTKTGKAIAALQSLWSGVDFSEKYLSPDEYLFLEKIAANCWTSSAEKPDFITVSDVITCQQLLQKAKDNEAIEREKKKAEQEKLRAQKKDITSASEAREMYSKLFDADGKDIH